MSNYEWQNINDESFEEMLKNSISEPPSSVISEVTPWKKSINRALAGIALETITLNFYYLNYILPAIGTIMKLLGFRTLKHENKWFKACYTISVILAVFHFSSLILNTTIFQSTFYNSSANTVIIFIRCILSIIEFFCLWRGFLTVQRKADLPAHVGGAVALIVFYVIIYLLALMEFEGLIIPIALIIVYIFIIRSLCKLSKELYEAGYVIRTKPIKITNRCIVISIVSILIVGFACGYVFGNGYPMKWTPKDSAEHANVEKIKSDLVALGFPEDVLNDISTEDISACNGALQVIVQENDQKVSYGMTAIMDSLFGVSSENGSEISNLHFTAIAVKIPAEQNRWMMFHHFCWENNPAFYGTEAIQIWPAYEENYYYPAGDATGRVLYDKDGETFMSDYDFLGTKTYTSESVFFGSQTSNDIFATFSMPKNSEHQRGYVAYPIDEVQFGRVVQSWCNYVHQNTLFVYPSVTAMEYRMKDSMFNTSNTFTTFQDQLTIHPEEIIAE
ncbi:MAG: hypothetical protein K2G60_03415 [Oscillospiraceae bacterium]|nr:hypothetical protein [Oscillospiraceae bacterium]